MALSQLEFTESSPLERVLAAAGVVAMSAGSAFVWYFDPTTAGLFPVCPLFKLTGLACPGCGLTRGFHALFHGDLITALDYNALIPIFVLIFGFFLISMMMVAVRGRGLVKLTNSPKLLFGFFVLLIVFGVLRNLPIYPLTFLYP
ncbi:MAG: DUF2752 domain-containing protein [Pyrinomonadaceae bacterium]